MFANDRAVIGGNAPPSQIDFVGETTTSLSVWMADNPVIQTGDAARAGKLLTDRAKSAIADMEAERKAKVDPLNSQVKVINDSYRSPRSLLENTLQELSLRIEAFVRREEDKRKAEAEIARKAVEDAERLAREAEAKEREAKENASQGEVGIDIATATQEADAAFVQFEQLARASARAEKATHVKVAGGFRRALSLRQKEELIVEDAQTAIGSLGLTDSIKDAILTSARLYRKQFGELPDGVISQTERTL